MKYPSCLNSSFRLSWLSFDGYKYVGIYYVTYVTNPKKISIHTPQCGFTFLGKYVLKSFLYVGNVTDSNDFEKCPVIADTFWNKSQTI